MMAEKLEDLMERMEARWARVEAYMRQGSTPRPGASPVSSNGGGLANNGPGDHEGLSVEQVISLLTQLQASQESIQKQLLSLDKRLGVVEKRLQLSPEQERERQPGSLTERLNQLQAEIDRLARHRS